MKRQSMICFFAVLMSGLLFCQTVPSMQEGQEGTEEAAGEAVEAVVGKAVVAAGNNEFALKLFGLLKQKEGNLFFSPFSVRTALAMTYSGARDQTASQMEKGLCFTGKGKFLLTGKRRSLLRAIAAFAEDLAGAAMKNECELRMANSLWAQEGRQFLPEFVSFLKTTYGAGLGEVDFAGAAEEARDSINEWVKGKTGNHIRELLEPGDLDPSIRLVLTNAIYFKGSWPRKFEETSTQDRPFFLAAGEAGEEGDDEAWEIPVPTMYKKGDFGYCKDEDLELIELPYYGEAISMVILLPSERDGLAGLEDSLTPGFLAERLQNLSKREVGVFLPRFKAATRFYLKETLAALGIADAFDGTMADFSGMTGSRDLWIDDVIHGAFVEVNEDGTKAAGATAAMVEKGGPIFCANHPFLFLIRDQRSGAILFMGRVTDPSKA